MRQLPISIVFSAILSVASMVAAPEAAQADLRYCNNTAKDAQVMEGHHTSKDGLTVQGTFNVRKGTCPSFHCAGSILPNNTHIGGFTNSSMHLADFMSIDTNGEANMVVTQRANFSMHFQLK
jgi:uncharacterized membrane protein